jgi:hypothetical protein
MKINQNELSVKVAKAEGKKVQVNISQIKEVQRCLLRILAIDYTIDDVHDLLRTFRIKARKASKK